MFDCLHDMGDPVGAAAHVETPAPAGTWMIVEPSAGDRLQDNLNPVGRVFYAASTLVCTPASRAQEVGWRSAPRRASGACARSSQRAGSPACGARRRPLQPHP
jgi:hypothetical protein